MMNPENKDLDGGIRNRVEESGLIQIDLGQLSEIKCVELDFTDWLWEGMIVKEKEFREKAKNLRPENYVGLGVGLTCTEDAIVPDWAWMLVSATLSTSEFVVVGGLENAQAESLKRAIENLSPRRIFWQKSGHQRLFEFRLERTHFFKSNKNCSPSSRV